MLVQLHVSLGRRPYCIDGLFSIRSSYELVIVPVWHALIHAPLQVNVLFNDSGRRGRTHRTGEEDCNDPAKVPLTLTTGR